MSSGGGPPAGCPQRAVVSAFDDARGLGEVTVSDGPSAGTVLPFHCTAIVGGGRTIEVGAAVVMVAVPGHGGRFEASAIRQLS